MGKLKQQLVLLLFSLILSVSYSLADSHISSNNSPEVQTLLVESELENSSTSSIHYIPPSTEKLRPELRVAKGGVRGDSDCSSLPTITLLVPNHVAYTTKVQPVFYFHSTGVIHKPVKLSLLNEDTQATVLKEEGLMNQVVLGINEIKTADYGISLNTNNEYQWLLQIGGKTQQSTSCPSIARAYVRKIEKKNDYSDLKLLQQAQKFAEQGIWYEALQSTLESYPDKENVFLKPLLKQIVLSFL